MWYNPIMIALLRSPLHGFVSNSMLVLQITGQKSGRVYTIPTSYTASDQHILVLTRPERIWWRNLRSGAPVLIWLKGKQRHAHAKAHNGDTEAMRILLTELANDSAPYARAIGVQPDTAGQIPPEQLANAGPRWVIIEIVLQPES